MIPARALLLFAAVPFLLGAGPAHAPAPRTPGFVVLVPVVVPEAMQGDSAEVAALADSAVQRIFRALNAAPVILVPRARVLFLGDSAPPLARPTRSAE